MKLLTVGRSSHAAVASPDEILSMHERAVHEGRRRSSSTLLDNRVTRALLSLAAALGIFVALARIPVYPEPGRVGWQYGSSQESISLYPLVPREEDSPPDPMESALEASAHIDDRQSPEEEQAPAENDGPERIAPAASADSSAGRDRGTIQAPLEIFELSGHQPELSGGVGSLYMHVDYPLAARQQGIQGRVILTFVVDEQGYTHDIQVMQSAHPTLDSAAVRAVRQTAFVPGRHNGEAVAVRMRLPIRFQLVSRN